jgi:hypothetical protein
VSRNSCHYTLGFEEFNLGTTAPRVEAIQVGIDRPRTHSCGSGIHTAALCKTRSASKARAWLGDSTFDEPWNVIDDFLRGFTWFPAWFRNFTLNPKT